MWILTLENELVNTALVARIFTKSNKVAHPDAIPVYTVAAELDGKSIELVSTRAYNEVGATKDELTAWTALIVGKIGAAVRRNGVRLLDMVELIADTPISIAATKPPAPVEETGEPAGDSTTAP